MKLENLLPIEENENEYDQDIRDSGFSNSVKSFFDK